jgi:hypothetical protein
MRMRLVMRILDFLGKKRPVFELKKPFWGVIAPVLRQRKKITFTTTY